MYVHLRKIKIEFSTNNKIEEGELLKHERDYFLISKTVDQKMSINAYYFDIRI